MVYLSLDTNIWLRLIIISSLENENNLLDELLFWLEGGHILYILPQNVKDEWDRHKNDQVQELKTSIKQLRGPMLNLLKGSEVYDTLSQPDEIEKIIKIYVDKIDLIFQTKVEIAATDSKIIEEAGQINLKCIAPNHKKDSFRDTVNILSLVRCLENKGYKKCIFSTMNWNDFSLDRSTKDKLHNQLESLFNSVELEYVYCDDNSIGKLFHQLRGSLPSYLDFLKAKKQKEQEQLLEMEKAKKITDTIPTNVDDEFIENILLIDMIIAKKSPNGFWKDVLTRLLERHDSYKQYFLKKVGNNGVV